ncbi:MAG: hypothetical protein ACI4F2_02220 [Acutalibacteraceae bacterium]
MDDFSDQISKILSDPQAMEQIRSMAGMLGGESKPQNSPEPVQAASSGNIMPPEILNAVSRIMPLMSEYNKEDDGTRLLAALRPFLSRERQKKLDEASRMLHILRFLPMIQKLGSAR